jgi:hypothetical protein
LSNDVVEHVKIINPIKVNCVWTIFKIYGVNNQKYQFSNSQAMGTQS